MIKKTSRKTSVGSARRSVKASSSITSAVRNRRAVTASRNMQSLTPEQRMFARQLTNNMRRSGAITAATNTTNIMAKPDFLELLPMFVQKLLIADVFGSVAMKSRQQLIPYFKFIAENTKGETNRGDILSSPFVNRQGIDENFTGRVVKNEIVGEGLAIDPKNLALVYTPILPNSVSVIGEGVEFSIVDDGNGNLVNAADNTAAGFIDYSTGKVTITAAAAGANNVIRATYQYDNENVGPRSEDHDGNFGYDYGAQMGKGYLQLDEINIVAEAHQLACYWSIYSAFAAQQEYGSNIGDLAKEAAFSELTAEINTEGFKALKAAAQFRPQFNWDASPVLSGSVVPSDYLNMFKLKLNQAAASIYQATRLTQPNRLVVGTNVASYMSMIEGFQAEASEDNVGPYKAGKLDRFEIYCDPSYNPDEWVMCCKSNDIRRNSALFGEYMPLTNTDAVGLANSSVQQGYATMYGMKVVNPDTVISGKILGTY